MLRTVLALGQAELTASRSRADPRSCAEADLCPRPQTMKPMPEGIILILSQGFIGIIRDFQETSRDR